MSPSLNEKNCLEFTPTTMCSILFINHCAAFLPMKTDLMKYLPLSRIRSKKERPLPLQLIEKTWIQ